MKMRFARVFRLVLALGLTAPGITGPLQAQQAPAETAALQQPPAAPQTELQQPEHRGGGEANLVVPDLTVATFLDGTNGRTLLMSGIVVCIFGLLFGFATYTQLRNLPVHRSMREVSELIYETCKTYLTTQGKFILMLWAFIALVVLL